MVLGVYLCKPISSEWVGARFPQRLRLKGWERGLAFCPFGDSNRKVGSKAETGP